MTFNISLKKQIFIQKDPSMKTQNASTGHLKNTVGFQSKLQVTLMVLEQFFRNLLKTLMNAFL